MEKWKTLKEIKKMVFIILILFGIIFIQSIEFLNFNTKLHNILLKRSTDQVEKVSKYIEKSFKLEVNQHTNTLKIIGIQLEKEKNMLSDSMVEQLKEIKKFSKFSEIGISDLDGNIVDSNGIKYAKVHKEIEDIIEKDEIYISDLIKSEEERSIFIVVPLKNGSNVRGSLWGKVKIDEVIRDIEFDENSDRYFQIIDDNGNYVMPSKNKYAMNKDEANIWEEMETYNYRRKETPERVYKGVQNGESGNFYIEKKGEGRYVNYHSLGISNWYVFSAQVEDQLHAHIKDIKNLISKFFVIIVLGLIAIFGIIYNIIHKMYIELADQHHQIKTVNAMLQAILSETKNIPFIIEKKYKKVALYGYPKKDNMKYYTFNEISVENMIEKGFLDGACKEDYQKFYQNTIIDGVKSEPVIVNLKIGSKKEWFRVSIISENEEKEDEIIGVLEGYSEQKEKDLKIENQLVDIKKIEKKSQTDFLTKLYNREAFFNKVQEELLKNKSEPKLCAFLILDIDNFKLVNDYMGHGMGDMVLKKIGDVLQSYFSKEEIVGRLGGDEFVIFLRGVNDRETFEECMKKLNQILCREYKKNGKKIQISASIGIVLTDKRNLSTNNLYKKADKALYKVKHSGRNGYEIYSEH